MNKLLIVLGLLISSLFIIGGCSVETSTGSSVGLDIQDSSFMVEEGDELVRTYDTTFPVGQRIYLRVLNVRGFERGEDGLHLFETDMEVTGPDGAVLVDKKGLLGDSGHADLGENGVAPSFTSNVKTPPTAALGDYKFKITVHDKVSGGKATKTRTFTLE